MTREHRVAPLKEFRPNSAAQQSASDRKERAKRQKRRPAQKDGGEDVSSGLPSKATIERVLR